MSDEDRKERKVPEQSRAGAGTDGAAGGKSAGEPDGKPDGESGGKAEGKPEGGPEAKTGGGTGGRSSEQVALSAEARKARAKEERLAEALRANLRRRKSAAKSRKDG